MRMWQGQGTRKSWLSCSSGEKVVAQFLWPVCSENHAKKRFDGADEGKINWTRICAGQIVERL